MGNVKNITIILWLYHHYEEPEWRSRYSDMATGWTTEGLEFESRWEQEYSLFRVVDTGSGVSQPPIQWAPGALYPGVKRQGREADHSPPATAEVKKILIHTFTPHMPSRCSA
jgi:hypothetical protein